MASNRRSSAEPGPTEGLTIVEEITKEQGIIRRYSKGRFLGKGGFAKCYEFTNLETRKVLAAKVIPKNSLTKNRARQKLMSEIKIHKSLSHKNIVKFEHFFEDQENVYILLEICTNQTMNELIKRRKRLTELEVQCYLLQILSSIKYLHDHKVIHRDLKLGNLFLSDKMEIKLGDFGLATKLEYDGERKRTICGTPNYIAPEILEAKETGHSLEVDAWSLGVIAYTLLIGKPPFETNDVKSTYKKIRTNDYCFPDSIIISSAAKNMIKKILQTDPLKRPTVNDLINDDFFKTSGSIPKLLPISTLACPPSASYIRQFLPQSTVQKQANYQVGRANSPKKFDNTTPLNNNNGFGSQVSQTAYNPSNMKSQQSVGLKERKDFINTYRTGGAQTSSSSGLGGSQYGQKNFDTNNVNNQKIENFQQTNKVSGQKTDAYPSGINIGKECYTKSSSLNPPQIEGYSQSIGITQKNDVYTKSTSLNNQQQADSYNNINSLKVEDYMLSASNTQKVLGYAQSTSLNHQKSEEYGKTSTSCQKTSNYAQSSTSILNGVQSLSNVNTNKNISGSNTNFGISQSTAFSNLNANTNLNLNNLSGSNQNYNSQSKNYPTSSNVVSTSGINRNSIEKYSSSSNVNQNGNSNYIRAKSEKMHTQPTSTLFQAYGFIRQDQPSSTNGTNTMTYNNSTSNLQAPLSSTDIQLQGPTIWVQKWVDYSSKYGLGYLLCNGQAGVFFNDSTKIILNPKSEQFDYIERIQHDKQDVGRTYKLQEYPEEIQKKVTLLQHFRSFLEGEDKTVKVSVQPLPQDMSEQTKSSKIYVKKWLRTKHAILFRLSNKVVQVIFQDSTEIILSSELRAVTYVNKKQERVTYPLTSAMESSNQEMSKRLRYTKDILTHMLGNGAQSSSKTGQQIIEEPIKDMNPLSTISNPLSTISNPLRTGHLNIDSKEKSHTKASSINANQGSTANLAPPSYPNNSSSSSSIQPSQKPTTRENLHYSKNGPITSVPSSSTNSYQQQIQQPHQVAYNNYTQNENINVMLYNKGSQNQQQIKSSMNGYELNGFASSNSGNKKDCLSNNTNIVNSINNNNMSIGQPQNIQNLLKSNSTVGRMNSMNPTATSSLSNLNNFNNYVMSSRKEV